MEIFLDLIKLNRDHSLGLSLQLSKGILNLIQKGSLQPKDRLPSVRKMASLLKIHPKTVVAAYEDLTAQSWLETVPRKGIYVSPVLPITRPMPFADKIVLPEKQLFKSSGSFGGSSGEEFRFPQLLIDDGFPDHRLAPWDIIMRDYRRFKQRPYAIQSSMYGDPAGCLEIRVALSKYLRETRALPAAQDDLCITRGAQMGLYLLCRTLISKGARVIVADPGYTLANDVLEECGAVLVKVPVETDGIDVDAISELCSKKKIDGIYIIPHHHHPTTACLSPQKRMALLEIAENYDLFIIEDDYDYDYHYDSSPVLPLASYARGRSIYYLGSISKVISNSLRLGFIYCNTPVRPELLRLRRLIDLRGDTFLELAIAEFFSSGEFDRHIKRTTKIYKERRDQMYALLTGKFADYISAEKPKGGMAIWAKFDSSIDLQELSEKAFHKGLGISDGSFYNTSINLNSIRIGFASKTPDEIYNFSGLLGALLKL